MARFFFLFLVCAVLISFGANTAFAGFGITPPYVRNESLARGTTFEQKIILVRGDPTEDLSAKIKIDVPGAEGWISVDKGLEVFMPEGANQVPIVFRVGVPDDAPFKTYKGNAQIVLSSAKPPTPGTVGIALGAQVDIRFTVVDETIIKFNVRDVEVFDAEEGHWFWWMYFPGKIKFLMQIENLGNVPVSPTRVQFDIYDPKGENLLEVTNNLTRMNTVRPYALEGVTAELPTRLSPGSYKVRFKIYNGEDIVRQGETSINILSYGSIPGYDGFGFIALSFRDKSIIMAGAIFLGLMVLYIFWKIMRRMIRRRRRN